MQSEIWLYDTAAMDFTRVTTSNIGGENRFPSLSADGETVAFESNADLLGEGRPNTQYEVWLADINAMKYTRVTTSTGGDTRISTAPSLNADGTIVAFQSDADLLNQGIPQGQDEIWLYDTTSKEYTRITTASETNRNSRHPHISADGNLVVFESDSDFFEEDIPEYQYEIWLYNTTSKEYFRITTASDSSRYSLRPRLSADGRFIVFYSNSDFLGQGISSAFTFEVWLYDIEQKWLSRITTGANNNQSSTNPSIIFDGMNLDIVFAGGVAASVPGIPTQREIWLYEGEPALISRLYLPLVLSNS
jgi:Tol biopolymer transport system component